jgi:uncharacterized protein
MKQERLGVMELNPLEPAQKNVLRIRFAIAGLALTAAALLFDATVMQAMDMPLGLLTGGAFLIALFAAILLPARRFRSWGYAMTDDELHIQSGIWTRARTVVPFGRVQHIDVSQGPVERRFGLGRLVLHTAGTLGSAVSLPGLTHEDAERMRDIIRLQIRQDLM